MEESSWQVKGQMLHIGVDFPSGCRSKVYPQPAPGKASARASWIPTTNGLGQWLLAIPRWEDKDEDSGSEAQDMMSPLRFTFLQYLGSPLAHPRLGPNLGC